MNTKYQPVLKQLQFLAILEGISYLSFALTMPLKYIYSLPEPNLYVGMAHGILFIAYCLWVLRLHLILKLKYSITALFLLASLIPLMTFWIDSKYLRKLHESYNQFSQN
jgi:integral membrane protein